MHNNGNSRNRTFTGYNSLYSNFEKNSQAPDTPKTVVLFPGLPRIDGAPDRLYLVTAAFN